MLAVLSCFAFPIYGPYCKRVTFESDVNCVLLDKLSFNQISNDTHKLVVTQSRCYMRVGRQLLTLFINVRLQRTILNHF